MKKTVSLILASALMLSLASVSFAGEAAEAPDKSEQPRVIVTTDLEVDDMNGVMLTLMFSSDFDLAGLVWTGGQFHFSGDGSGTTFAEAIAQYEYAADGEVYTIGCEGTTAGGTVETIDQVTEYRPADPEFLNTVLDAYEADYPLLSQNDPMYPTPEYLRSITKVGNIEFEGDYREETEGSELICNAILDDDMRPLYIQHWGGINTTVRALQSIYEDYYGTDEWDAVLSKVVEKVRISGTGEDNCWAYSKMEEKFPGIVTSTGLNSFFSFGNYFMANTPDQIPVGNADAETLPYYKGTYLTEAFKMDHGQVMGMFHLMHDGAELYGEPECYQYGLHTYIDWGESWADGWGTMPEEGSVLYDLFCRHLEYDDYDWMCCQFGTNTFVDIGLRTDIPNSSAKDFKITAFEELAARADWAICAPADCNHPPVITCDAEDVTVAPGTSVTFTASVEDPDGDDVTASWWTADAINQYGEPAEDDGDSSGASSGEEAEPKEEVTVNFLKVSEDNPLEAVFTVPEDALSGNYFVVTLEVKDTDAERPMTRFAQYVITVE